jgi:hypothetical protein
MEHSPVKHNPGDDRILQVARSFIAFPYRRRSATLGLHPQLLERCPI